MKSIHFKAFLLIIASLAQMVQAQDQGVDNWNVPWVIIGDSTLNIDRNSKVVVTGTILDAESQQPIAGASVAADFFKYYDYSDENGAYVLELPPGNYRVRIKPCWHATGLHPHQGVFERRTQCTDAGRRSTALGSTHHFPTCRQ